MADIIIKSAYPSVDDLRTRARQKIPKFAFEYLDGGCNEDVNLIKNTADIRKIELRPYYLSAYSGSSTAAEIFGIKYDAPVGIAPVGLQGLMWPKAPEILAKAAFDHNIPFILSTVTTADIETIGRITQGNAWFQLYHPRENELRDKLINRAADAGYPVLVILSDVPTFGVRPRDIRNGLAMPPKMSLRNIMQIFARPEWAMKTLMHGQPEFTNMKPYMPPGLDMQQLGKFMDQTFSGRLNEERIKPIRDMWKGKLVIKGIATVDDAQRAYELGVDGIIVSNHGGRQLDAGESAVNSLIQIVEEFGDKFTVMMDSGLRSGVDVARCMAAGAKFTFMGRSFMYGVAALGDEGGHHTISLIKRELQQVLEQVCCPSVDQLPLHLIKR